jgi:hypothetical protein
VLEEASRHLEVVDGDISRDGVGSRDEAGSDVGRPGEAPYDRVKVLAATEPDATGAALACVAKANVRGEVGDEFADVGRGGGCRYRAGLRG